MNKIQCGDLLSLQPKGHAMSNSCSSIFCTFNMSNLNGPGLHHFLFWAGIYFPVELQEGKSFKVSVRFAG